jgi:Fe-S cluster biosynthesis and repair protein YggX
MSRTVLCRKYQQELPGLAHPPIPGPKGQDIYDHVSQKAWQEWMSHQTMLINEQQLNLMDTGTRVYLGEQMTKFLTNDDYDAAEGYVPPADDK